VRLLFSKCRDQLAKVARAVDGHTHDVHPMHFFLVFFLVALKSVGGKFSYYS
jgi:hypothetical protein